MPANILNKNHQPDSPRSAADAPKAEKAVPKNLKSLPSPLISKHSATANISLLKQLTAYPNYGNPSKKADILYTGNIGNWDIEIPPFLLTNGSFKIQLIIRSVLDDHVNVTSNRYAAIISFNGVQLHKGRLPLEHGSPAASVFSNWRELTFTVPSLRKDNRITIENISATAPKDWIGFDWMELRLFPR